jgi:TP901-1 family phage major tail protein
VISYWQLPDNKGLTINRSKDSIEITSKDTKGGWKSKIGGMKEWSIDNDGLYVRDDESHKVLGQYFDGDDPVCIKVLDMQSKNRDVRWSSDRNGLFFRSSI